MKLSHATLGVFIGIFISTMLAPAATKGGKGKKKSAPPAQQKKATAKPPSELLGLLLGNHLDRLLSPFDTIKGERDRANDMKLLKVPVASRAEVTKLDQQFRARGSTATAVELPILQRALAVTKGLTELMDERDKQASFYIQSRTTRALSPLAAKNTKKQRKDARQQTHETKNFMSSGLEQRWLQTATRYRQQINELMDLLRSAEREVKP